MVKDLAYCINQIFSNALPRVFTGTTLFLLLIAASLSAQNLNGLSYSNYAGTQGIYQNPSSITDSRHKLFINLFSLDGHASNSFVRYDAPFSMLSLAKKISSNEDHNVNDAYLKGKLDGDRKIFSAGLDVRGPSVMYALDDYNAIAITTRLRSAGQINNMSEAVARLLVLGADAPELQNLDFFRKRFDLNVNTFSEIGLSFATSLMDDGASFLKGGFTVKRLAGIYSAHLLNNEATYRILSDNEIPNEQTIEVNSMKGNLGYTGSPEARNFYQVHNWITGSSLAGSGFGFDLGFTFERRPISNRNAYQMDGKTYKDNTINKYKYRVGIALLDVGGIKYEGEGVNSYNIDAKNLQFKLEEFNEADNASDVGDTVREIIGLQNNKSQFTSGLPIALNVNVDVLLKDKMYLAAVWMPGLRAYGSTSMRHNTFLSVIPRYETKNFEFSMPVSITDNYHNVSAGAMVRVGPVFIGSDNIAGILNMGSPHGANLYTGLSFSIGNKKLKDGDMDGVSDKKDKCPNEKGLLKFEGCPDTDGDGIPDFQDDCPNTYGSISNKGCPQVKLLNGYSEIQLTKQENKVVDETYEKLEYESGKADISPNSTVSLNKLAELLLKRPGYKLLIQGHTDNTGTPENNMILSINRANAVKEYLIKRGVDSKYLIAEGFGDEKPIADNNTEEGRRLNRKVDFKIVE